MKNVLQLPKISKIIFSERSDTWFAPQGTPKLQKILSVWLPHQKHSKNCSFFELDYGYPRCYQHIIWVWGAYQSLFRPKKELLTIRECFLRFVHVFKKFEIFGKNCPWGGHMQKFRPQEGCAWCVHILGMERDCLLGSFKVMKYILDRFWARGYSARPPRPKSANFRPKIADLPKFRCRNFGRGCPERPKFFFELQNCITSAKKIFMVVRKFEVRLSKSLGGGRRQSPPPRTCFTRI